MAKIEILIAVIVISQRQWKFKQIGPSNCVIDPVF